jgi:hypothetical protein
VRVRFPVIRTFQASSINLKQVQSLPNTLVAGRRTLSLRRFLSFNSRSCPKHPAIQQSSTAHSPSSPVLAFPLAVALATIVQVTNPSDKSKESFAVAAMFNPHSEHEAMHPYKPISFSETEFEGDDDDLDVKPEDDVPPFSWLEYLSFFTIGLSMMWTW